MLLLPVLPDEAAVAATGLEADVTVMSEDGPATEELLSPPEYVC
jgi:hypothetical protein